MEVGVGEYSGPGRVGPGSDDLADIDQILVGKHVVGVSLRIPAGSHAIGEVGEEAPVLKIKNAAADFSPVRMNVDEAGNDGGAGQIDHLGIRWNGNSTVFPDGSDTVIFHDNVGVGDDVIAVHGNYLRAAQHNGSGGMMARELERNGDFLRFRLLFLFFVGSGLCVRRRCAFGGAFFRLFGFGRL